MKALSGFYYVESAGKTVACRGRGRLRLDGTAPLVGDRVVFSEDGRGAGSVERILPRKNRFVRPAVANVDVLIAVASETNPVTDPFLIDRVTSLAEYRGCRTVICVNKADLSADGGLCALYARAGYTAVRTSAQSGEGVTALRSAIAGCVCAFYGNSGVGKSSLLNALEPSLCLPVGEVSEKLGRGRHTTRHVELFRVGPALVADTPGFAAFDAEAAEPIPKEALADTFPEFAPYLGRCRFDDCAHVCEPDCAVRAAVGRGDIAQSRYESYCRLLELAAEYKKWDN